MKDLKIRLMLEEARKRYSDGESLARIKSTDSSYLLKLLGFELSLKTLLYMDKGTENYSHKYSGMFASLSKHIKKKIIEDAQSISQIFDIKIRIDNLLRWYEYNFIKLRYPYQNYENMNEGEYKEYSDLYVELGAPDGEAEFEYYPEELRGLYTAITEYISKNC
jgi:hypothetical protein